ncbi:MAG: hypothetical protein WAL01_11935, partial [Pseudolabrys sp.]
MRNVGRKLAFVLAAFNHGTMITNRFDYRMSGRSPGIGAGGGTGGGGGIATSASAPAVSPQAIEQGIAQPLHAGAVALDKLRAVRNALKHFRRVLAERGNGVQG